MKGNKVHVTKQVLIAYDIDNLKDEVLCDILPMDACHLFFRRPWQFDKGAIYNGKASTYTFKVKGCNYTLTPLPLSKSRMLNLAMGRETQVRKPYF